MKAPPRSCRLVLALGQFAAGLGAALSASVALGWLSHTDALLLRLSGAPPMVLWAAVTNFIVGSALLLLGRRSGQAPSPARPATAQLLGGMVVAFGVWSFAGILGGRNLGLDLPALHAWVPVGHSQPGCASPYSSAAFVLLGLALAALRGQRRARMLGAVCIVSLGALGIGGLVALALRLEYIELWPRQAGLAEIPALVFSLYALALAAHAACAAGMAPRLTPAQKIHLLAIVVLVAVSVLVGAVGLAAMQRRVQEAQYQAIDAVAADGQHLSEAGISLQSARARQFAAELAEITATGVGADVALQREARRWLGEGVRCAQVLGPGDTVLGGIGGCTHRASASLALRGEGAAQLLADGGYVLQSTLPLPPHGKSARRLRLQLTLPRLSRMLATAQHWNGSRVALCAAHRGGVSCVDPQGQGLAWTEGPSELSRSPSATPQDSFDRDATGALLVTRWRPVGQTGLTLRYSVPTFTLYAPLRSSMQWMVAFLVVAVALGAAFIDRGLRPLIRALEAARQLAAENLDIFRTASDSAQDGIMLLEAVRDADRAICDFNIVYVNLSGLRQLGLTAEEIQGKRFLTMARTFPRMNEYFIRCREVVETGTPALVESPCFASADTSNQISRNITKVHDGVMVVARDTTASWREAQRLADSAMVDELTGLPNERAVNLRLAAACETARARDRGVAVAYCDLDDFKPVNDRLGHACGDEVLRHFARSLQAAVRRTDMVARLHGDEFIVVLEDLGGPAEAARVMQDLYAGLDQPVTLCGATMTLRASVGLAYAAGAQADAAELLKRADVEMYSNKLRRKGQARAEARAGEVAASPVDVAAMRRQ